MGALLACCMAGLTTGDIQFEMYMVVPAALNETQFASDILRIARNASQEHNETMAAFSPTLQILGSSSILCLLGMFCFEEGLYTYSQTPGPQTPSQDAAGALIITSICVLALAGVCLLYLCRRRPKKARVAIRATIDWPVPDKRAL